MYPRTPGLATANSLVLVDEVGRGTSVREGVAISHAIAEELIRLKVFPTAFRTCYSLTVCVRRGRATRASYFSQRETSHDFVVWNDAHRKPAYSHFGELTTTLSRQPSVVKYVVLFIYFKP